MGQFDMVKIVLFGVICMLIGIIVPIDITQDHSPSVETQIVYLIGPPLDPETVGYMIFTTQTPVSEPYYIDDTLPKFKVGDWVKSTSEYKRLLYTLNPFCGKVVEIDDDILTVDVGNGNYEYVNVYWIEPWGCGMVIYDPDIGYYCHMDIIHGIHCFTNNSTVVTQIYK